MMKKYSVIHFTLAAMFLALGFVLPFFTGQIPQIGKMLLPMHIPVFLCGLICGWKYGALVGFITPILRSVVIGIPVLYPKAVGMAFELMAYGLIAGLLYSRARHKGVRSVYACLILSMLGGRIVWGLAQVVLLGVGQNGFTYQAFIATAFLNAIPGIILQLVLIPAVMVLLNKTGLIPLETEKHHVFRKDSAE